MPSILSKKRKLESAAKRNVPRPRKKFRKQTDYHSSSSSPSDNDVAPADLEGTDNEETLDQKILSKSPPKKDIHLSNASASPLSSSAGDTTDSSANIDSDSDISLTPSQFNTRKITKRKDPAAFSSSITAILGTKLPTSLRADPVLARSLTAKQASHSLAESKLETLARKAVRADRKLLMEKGRVRDVLLGDEPKSKNISTNTNNKREENDPEQESSEPGLTAAETQERERKLRKTAQRGVVKLFNAVRAAQVKGEEAAKEMRKQGLVGGKRREERVGEMGKKAFLEMVGSGGANR
jgi:hypothetical protein